ncbi:hypothetical protein [Actinophytocola sp.]|uniref:hypothetical protein n=1 Tax=Actinophytocola sp. TaxID=1872138 RepID=UPI003D6B6E2A
MRGRVRGVVAAAALALGLSATGFVAGGTASAAQPIVVGDCSTTVSGEPGTPLALSPAAVLDPVLNVVRAVPLIGPGLVSQVSARVSSMGNIPLGTLPAADTSISGGTIAAAAVPRIRSAIRTIPLIGGVLGQVVSGVQGVLSSGCGIVVNVANTAAAPVQDGTKAVADTSEKVVGALVPGGTAPGGGGPGAELPGGGNGPGGPGAMPRPNQPPIGGYQPGGWSLYQPGLSNFGRWPMADYGSVPYARAGLFAPAPGVRYGGNVPGYTPEFGILGADHKGDGVQAAGRAEALTPPEGQKIALPVLLAVLALSVVTAALVRTWVLRRAPAAAL